MSKKDYTHIVLVIDRSASFKLIKADVIQGINGFLGTQSLLDGEATLTLVLFDNTVDFLTDNQPLGDVTILSPATYVPRNQTALLDAVGTAIVNCDANLKKLTEEELPEMIVFIVLSDGDDVASATFNKKQVEELVKKRYEAQGWEFLFLIGDPDGDEIADRMGALNQQVLSFQKTGPGLLLGLESLNRVVTDYRNLKIENCEFTVEDVQKQEALAG